jgi:hypothetical protein
MKTFPLWGYGIMLIGAGAFVAQTGLTLTGQMTAEEQGHAAGRGTIALLAWVVGLTFIVISAVKGIRASRAKRASRER